MDRKLQVFVSSTYLDMKPERQAAVEMILSAGHIPAGMELFTAGDESQLEVIHRWIDESDVFLLILGGRYGSVERKSGKSYIQLEYEYARRIKKPYFSIVAKDEHLAAKIAESSLGAATEQSHPQEYANFKKTVTEKMVAFYSNLDQLRLAISNKMNELSRRTDLVGWVRADRVVDTKPILEEMTALQAENARLKAVSINSRDEYAGLSFDAVLGKLKSIQLDLRDFPERYPQLMQSLKFDNLFETNLYKLIIDNIDILLPGESEDTTFLTAIVGIKVERYGLAEWSSRDGWKLTDAGKRFFNILDVSVRRTSKA